MMQTKSTPSEVAPDALAAVEGVVDMASAGGQMVRAHDSDERAENLMQPTETEPASVEAPAGAIASFARRIRLTLQMIKFQHTIFALPFALLGGAMAAGGWPEGIKLFGIVLACVFARSAAMTFNRLLDEPFDRENPRTRDWPLPAGLLTRGFAWIFCLVCVGGFVGSAAMLNPLALKLSPLALLILLGYSAMKRVTPYTHFFLGLALGIAPIGAWVAVSGELPGPAPILLGLAVMLWTAGFDIIYSMQDVDFDRAHGLNSLPVRLGRRRALAISALCHMLALIAFLSILPLTDVGVYYMAALAVCAWLLVYEQKIVSPNDLSRLGRAFFTVNGWIGVLMFAGGLTDILLAA